eukprot:CAMPEP_0198711428 /NCGR_PEP_ID=MMETSP1471-20131121/3521_1 /TAXON_ID=41880 /ORGANISM="Pycnococcus provasolii, Strain RCC733" /LENGTH=90 /DNA_ID=CAMNT_0044471255 /DNA_START=310 /DNA_END=582 /DNA_ORIENTATION=-
MVTDITPLLLPLLFLLLPEQSNTKRRELFPHERVLVKVGKLLRCVRAERHRDRYCCRHLPRASSMKSGMCLREGCDVEDDAVHDNPAVVD